MHQTVFRFFPFGHICRFFRPYHRSLLARLANLFTRSLLMLLECTKKLDVFLHIICPQALPIHAHIHYNENQENLLQSCSHQDESYPELPRLSSQAQATHKQFELHCWIYNWGKLLYTILTLIYKERIGFKQKPRRSGGFCFPHFCPYIPP